MAYMRRYLMKNKKFREHKNDQVPITSNGKNKIKLLCRSTKRYCASFINVLYTVYYKLYNTSI